MEAFGLLNFIKSALALAEKQPPSPATPNQTEQTQQPINTKPTPEKQEEKKGKALSAFLEKHEQIAKKFRK